MGRNSLLLKIDIIATYMLVPVCSADCACLGMCWKEQVYVNIILPFGLYTASKIFNAMADGLEWSVVKAGVQVLYRWLYSPWPTSI